MALSFTITKSDMLRSKVLDPTWYQARVEKVTQEKAKDGESINTWIHFKVTSGPSQGKDGSSPIDTPLRRCFSEKAPGFAVPFLKACGATVKEEGGTYDMERSVGQEMLVFVKNRMYEEQLQNDVADFRPLAA